MVLIPRFCSLIGATVLIGALLSARCARADTGDATFPALLRPGVTLATGVPYVAITDLTLGLGPHAALGVLAGVTPRVAGAGIHPRFAVGVAQDWRAIARVPLLYYPETNDAEQWALSRPSLVLEHAFAAQGPRLYGGGGLLWASCLDAVFGEGHARFPDHAQHEADEAPMQVLFWTANLGGSLPLAERLDGFVDVASVMDGFALAGPQWTDFGGPPLLVVLGVTARL